MTTIQEIINGTLISNNVVVDGVSGNGFITMGSQATIPATPVGGYSLYANTSSDLTIVKQDGFSRTIDMPATANVTYTLPNTGNSSFIMSAGNQTIGGNKTFSSDVTLQGLLALPATTSTVGQITIAGARFIHSQGTTNVFVGSNAGNFTLTGSGNVVVGTSSNTAATSGSNNTILGQNAASALTNGSNNIIIGQSAGSAISTTGSNILIGSSGIVGDTNVIRIGTSQTSAYVTGVANSTSDTVSQLVFVNPTTNKLWAATTFSLQQFTILGTISTVVGTINSWITGGTYEVTSATNVPNWCIITGNIVVITIPAFAFVCSSNTNSTIRYTITSGGTFPFVPITANIKWWSVPINSNNTTQSGIISVISGTVWELTRGTARNFAASAQGTNRRIVLTYDISR